MSDVCELMKFTATSPKSIVPIIGEPDIDESYIRQQDFVPPFEVKPTEDEK